ncbi:MAG: AMP-binding protein [Gammaproteobacteria bacterium]|nr:AMP-binding protein [Gammaproteobacteria bacterium]
MTEQKNPLDMLFHWAQKYPHKPYLFQPVDGEWRSYTWSQVEDQVRRMAAALRSLVTEPGSRIAISGRNTAHWIMADLAISLAGHVSVGLYPKQATGAVRYILDHSETKLVFVGPMPDEDDFEKALPPGVKRIAFPYPDVGIKCDLRWDDLIARHAPLASTVVPAPDTLMTLIYTSGTTGNPKGVMVTYGNMIFAGEGLMQVMPPQGQERFFSYLPLAHAFERGAVEFASLHFGAEVHFLESIEKLAEQLQEVAPTRFFGVPLVYGRIQAGVLKKLPQQKLERLNKIPILRGFVRRKILAGIGLQNARMCFVGAAPMPIPLMEWFKKYLGLEIYQGYGMTENSIYATASRPGANRLGAVGREMPGANLKISEDGEILFKHPGVMKGYYKEPEKTQEVFTADGYLRTGDKGRVDADGYLYITGRVKDIFKTLKGKYVAPAPIEGALSRNTDIDQLCFVGTGLKQPIMLVSLAPAARARPKNDVEKGLLAEMAAVNKNLEAHEEIAKILVVKDAWTIDNGLMTPTLKVKRNEVEKRYGSLVQVEAEKRTPIAWEA